MSASKSSLLNLKNLSEKNVEILFSEALKLKTHFNQHQLTSGVYHSGYKGTAALLFFEPSTRTRFSFEAACSRSGFHPLILDGGIGTSLEKGETVEDTIFNIQAMRPLFFVIRCNDLVDLESLQKKLSVPVLNAGWGQQGHPTQALLDALTLFEKFKTLKNKNILFIGDVKHSRVVSSHLELAEVMGYNIGFCAPSDFLRNEQTTSNIKIFHKLNEALQWADAAIALRLQKERHENDNMFLIDDYKENYGLNQAHLKNLKPEALIMHPGPVNYGIEVEHDIQQDPRNVILKQVENGVFVREAIIRQMIKGES
jgi:aspartate carbamoyltransferase catalytic subunit